MAGILDNLSGLWQRAGIVQRVTLLSVVLACAGAGVLLVNWARRPSLALLYSGLSPQEASKIVEKLRDSDTPYELKEGGTAVYAPADKIYQLRLSLAGQNLPGGDQAGYHILDEEKLGASPFTQRLNHTRALEGELAKSIQLIEGVAAARVHLVRPEGTLFAAKGKEPSATVVLRLKGKAAPGSLNVAAIVHLVAGSVEGLSAEKVVVVDGQGNLLSGAMQNDLARGAGNYLDYKSQVERYLSHKAEEMLASVLGPNKATVKVNAEVDTNNSSEVTETYDPEKRVVAKEDVKTKSAGPTTTPAAGNASSTKEETTTSDYLVSKTVQTKTQMPGQVKNLTVAAFVDLRGPAKEGGPGQAAPEIMPIKDVEDVIRNAIGLKTTDTLKVVNVAFPATAAQAAPQEEPAGMLNKEFYLDIAQRGSLGLLVIGALVALKMFRSGKKSAAAPYGGPGAGALEAGGSTHLLPAGGEVNPEHLRARISRALQENPEEVKQLFLNWVESRKEEL
jgi:flagellar M-ring protein FliF